mgnify:FL=1
MERLVRRAQMQNERNAQIARVGQSLLDYRAEQERARPQEIKEITNLEWELRRERQSAAEQQQAQNPWLRSTILNYIGKPIPGVDPTYFPPAPRAAEQEQARVQNAMQNFIASSSGAMPVEPIFGTGITKVFDYKQLPTADIALSPFFRSLQQYTMVMGSPLGIVGERRTPPSASTTIPPTRLDPPPVPSQTTRRILFAHDEKE